MINKEVTNMNKKEVLEIRKQFSPENCAITRICGCYVDHEKEKKMEMKKAFLSMPEEEAFKYFDIFKHTLSGTVGKNLMTMEFPLDQELEGGAQELLLRLRDTKLTDDLQTYTFRNDRKEPHQHGIPTRPGIERRHTGISDETKEQQASGRPSSRRIL